MFNTLEDARLYLEKEVDLLDSIYDNFQAAKSSTSNMVQYLKQFEKIVEGVKANKIKVSDTLSVSNLLKSVEMQRTSNSVSKNHRYERNKKQPLKCWKLAFVSISLIV